jgi:phosphoglycerate dehydrogenase-like enzyme
MLCINYTPDRFHLFGAKEIAAMKKGAFIINVARGGLLDPDALLAALRSGHIAGAGLDVFWQEPVDMSHPIFAENVIATPHIAGVTEISYEGIARAFAENMKRYAAGEKPLYLANAPDPLRKAKPDH